MSSPDDRPETTLVDADPYREEREDRGVHLIVLRGSNVGQVYTLGRGGNTIGRDDGADIRIVDPRISRHHATVTWDAEDEALLLADAGSRNGTWVDEQRVQGSCELARGDKIRLGTTVVLRVSFGDELETGYAHQMYEAALRDGLTGCFNRRYFDERLLTEIRFAVRHLTPLSLVMLDIDHFKRVNDTHGHAAGDEVLKELVATVTRSIRMEDVVARYGGEEFAIICRDTDEARAAVLAERIRRTIAAHTFALGDRARVTVSLGVADLAGCGDVTEEAILGAADQALYWAKQEGRDRVVRYSSRATPPTLDGEEPG